MENSNKEAQVRLVSGLSDLITKRFGLSVIQAVASKHDIEWPDGTAGFVFLITVKLASGGIFSASCYFPPKITPDIEDFGYSWAENTARAVVDASSDSLEEGTYTRRII